MLPDLHIGFLKAGQVVWYSHLFQNFPQFIVIHTVKGFGIVNKAEIVVFIELSCTSRHILIKLTKIKYKEQILTAAREKQQITCKGIPIRITADLSTETLQAKREWHDILKVMKENNLQPRLRTQQGSHSNMKEKSKALQTSKKLREFSTTKPALQKC